MTRHLSSLDNPFVKQLAKLRENKRYREDMQQVVIAGKSLVIDLAPRFIYKMLILSEGMPLPEGMRAEQIYSATLPVLRKITGVESPDGYAAVLAIPEPIIPSPLRFLVACDRIMDPGNLGTIIRSAAALGWDAVYLLPGTCDPFNDKVLRASRGASLTFPLIRGAWQDLKVLSEENKLRPFVADIEGVDSHQVPPAERVLLVLGNEAQGPDSFCKDWCRQITIPMKPGIESLNVSTAGSILMYTLKIQS